MSVKSKSIKSDLKTVDTHTIKPEEYDDLPELTDEMFERAVYKVGGIKKPAPRLFFLTSDFCLLTPYQVRGMLLTSVLPLHTNLRA
jgi:hypothetical protein